MKKFLLLLVVVCVAQLGHSQMTIEYSKTDISCYGDDQGGIDISISGGTPPHTALWSNGSTLTNLSNLSAGSYDVEIMDANSSISYQTVIITSPTKIEVSESITHRSCNGGILGTISLNTSGGVGGYSYYWAHTSNDTPILNNLPNQIYQVSVVDQNGCSAVEEYQITQPISFNLYVIEASDDYIKCVAENPHMITNISGGIAPFTYQWSTGETTATILPHISLSTNYVVTVTDAYGCVAISDTTIYVVPEPPIIIQPTETQGCAPLTAQFIEATEDDIDLSYIWEFGDGGTSMSKSPEYTYNIAGIYNVKVTVLSALGCARTQYVDFDIAAYHSPTASFEASTSTLFDPNITFTNLSAGYDGYDWIFGDGTTSRWDENPIHGYPHAGYYDISLMVVTIHGCRDTSTMQIYAYRGDAKDINELNSNSIFDIHPNPAASTLHISNIQEAQKVQICNLTGEIALEEIISEQLDISTLKAGGYILKLLNNNEVVGIKKFIKQ